MNNDTEDLDTEVESQDQADDGHLNMSDEDFLKAGYPADVVAPAADGADPDPDDEEQDETDEADTDEGEGSDAEADAGEGAADQASAAAATDEGGKADEGKAEETTPEAKAEAKSETPETPEAPAVKVDFEAEYKKLLAPFKANGREIAVQNVDDAITLMQMGANYNKKMAALKPNLKLMKLLENNGLMSEEKISFLIDLEKKNPDAINKLVKDSGIDPMDLDAEKASGYKQTTYTVDDREIDLDTVLDEIQETPTYNRTLDVVSNKWDVASKQVVAGAPQLLKVINDHISSGIYDLISKEIESERVFGRLSGLSDIEAYRQVGDAIQARGGFNHLVKGSSQDPGKSQSTPPKIVTPKPKVDEDKLKEKRRAASSTKPAAASAPNPDFNPLSMSDEEFSKQVNSKFL